VLRKLGHHAVAAIVTRWIEAWHADDVNAIVAMLADDVREYPQTVETSVERILLC
jgi:RNA polymerase sigma-70 factor (ECF subfamily)